MYVYECKHCCLTKTLDFDVKLKKCIRCGKKLEDCKKVHEKYAFDFPNIIAKPIPQSYIVV